MNSPFPAQRFQETPPPLSTLALVSFDKRKGSTIKWKRSLPGLESDASLEYKALPSGLHSIESDLVYFILDDNAGLSAFENAPASQAERNASFVAVVALVPLNGSRLGKIWAHANKLQDLASLARKESTTLDDISTDAGLETDLPSSQVSSALQQYWDQTRAGDESPGENSNREVPESSNNSVRRKRARGFTESLSLQEPSIHPARSSRRLMEFFGPLIFPLHRASLLRKRILIITHPPMQTCCDMVYLLSVLSAIPRSVSDSLPASLGPLKPLFAVGIADIGFLEALDRQQNRPVENSANEQHPTSIESGWIACTSDELLASKDELYDVKIEFPRTEHDDNGEHVWPTLTDSSKQRVFATQRDLRRYKALLRALNREDMAAHVDDADNPNVDGEDAALIPKDQTTESGTAFVPNENMAVEPSSWASIAYDSFVWWASAGERSAELEEEYQHDNELLHAMRESSSSIRPDSPSTSRRKSLSGMQNGSISDNFAVAIVAYFHRLTTLLLSTILDAVDEADPGTQDENDEALQTITITKEDLNKMGLDVWSKSDREFVKALAEAYVDVDAQVYGASVECCGVRVV